MKLNIEQTRAKELFLEWWYTEAFAHPFKLNGYAGTGKTTVVLDLIDSLGLQPHQIALLAPTGKAADVLAKRTGWPTSTIHKALYTPKENGRIAQIKQELTRLELDAESNSFKIPSYFEEDDPFFAGIFAGISDPLSSTKAKLIKELDQLTQKDNSVSFSFKEGSDLQNKRLIVIDEISMVNEQLAEDLLSLSVPLLLLGDPGQLPPVKAKAGFQKVEPAITLTEIMRQEEASSVLKAATIIRNKEKLPTTCDWGSFKRVRKKELTDTEYSQYDIVLCGTHRVRKAFNRRLRKALNYNKGWLPEPGEKLICRKNNYEVSLMNGQILTVVSAPIQINSLTHQITAIDDTGIKRTLLANLLRLKEHYDNSIRAYSIDHLVDLDFAYCLTVHSAQGSEWPSIVALNDWPAHNADYTKWLYTALTRASKEAVLVG